MDTIFSLLFSIKFYSNWINAEQISSDKITLGQSTQLSTFSTTQTLPNRIYIVLKNKDLTKRGKKNKS